MAASVEQTLAVHVHVLANGLWTRVPETDMGGETDGDRVSRGRDFNERRWVNASDATVNDRKRVRSVSNRVGKGRRHIH